MEDFDKDLKKVISLEERAKTKASLQDIEVERYSSKKTTKKYWFVAASIAVLVSFIGYALLFNQKTATNELYAQHFKPYRNVIQPIVRGEEQQHIKTKAFVAYENGEYTIAADLLKKIYAEEKNNAYLLYQGISLLQLHKTDEAIQVFKKQLQISDEFNTKTYWYLALAYLKNKDVVNAKKTLQILLKSSENYKKQEAESILKKLE